MGQLLSLLRRERSHSKPGLGFEMGLVRGQHRLQVFEVGFVRVLVKKVRVHLQLQKQTH